MYREKPPEVCARVQPNSPESGLRNAEKINANPPSRIETKQSTPTTNQP
jgi:hypothetical protein